MLLHVSGDLDPPHHVLRDDDRPAPRRRRAGRVSEDAPPELSLQELVGQIATVSRRRRMAFDVTTGAYEVLDGDRGDAAQSERVDDGELLLLPRAEDVAEAELARGFALDREDDEARDALLWALRGSGALVCFRDAARRLELTDEWTRVRDGHLAELALRWLERNRLAYRRDLPRWGRLRRV
jgi:hypothetical protein